MRTCAIYLTGACNLRCKHCSVGLDQYRPRPTLTDSDVTSILSKVAERGVEYFTFLGGEPTVGPHDLDYILEHCHFIGLKVSINTNLLEYERLEPLCRHKSLVNVVVSLDGAAAATHDAVRGRGSFDRTYANLKRLLRLRDATRPDMTVDITFSLSEANRADAIGIVDIAKELSVDGLNINLVQQSGRGKIFSVELFGDSEEYFAAIAEMIAYVLLIRPKQAISIPLPPALAYYIEKRYRIPTASFANHGLCGGTDVYAYVDLHGNLLPCPGMSFEESRRAEMDRALPELDLRRRPIGQIEADVMFSAFERERWHHGASARFTPCDRCRFAPDCAPCTSKLYKDEDNVIDLCQRLYDIVTEKDLGLEIWK